MHFYYDHLPVTLDSEKRAEFFLKLRLDLSVIIGIIQLPSAKLLLYC